MQNQTIYLSDDHVASLTPYTFQELSESPENWVPARRPAILVVPGGGYTFCSEREGEPVAFTFNQAGYQCFVLNYHVNAASAYPTPLVEIAQACAHIRRNAQKYHIDENKIAVIGFSAGGHLAALLGSTWHEPFLAELTGLSASAMQPNALVLAYPLVNLKSYTERLKERDPHLGGTGAMLSSYAAHSDPLALVNPSTPPTYIFQTVEDKLILALDVMPYVDALIRHNIDCEFHLFDKGVHGLSTADALSCYGWDFPSRLHYWLPMAIAWLNELFQYDF